MTNEEANMLKPGDRVKHNGHLHHGIKDLWKGDDRPPHLRGPATVLEVGDVQPYTTREDGKLEGESRRVKLRTCDGDEGWFRMHIWDKA